MTTHTPTTPSLSPPSRRAVVRGAAWTAPAVALATAAPATAASLCTSCQTQVIDWDAQTNYARTDSYTGLYTLPITGTATSGAQQLRLNIDTRYYGKMRSGVRRSTGDTTRGETFNENLRITDGVRDPGNINAQGAGLQLHQQPDSGSGAQNSTGSRADRTQTVFRFSEPVCSLSFTIRDIDAYADDYYDEVEISSPSPYTSTRGGGLVGSGTPTSPWHARGYYAVAPTDGNYAVAIRFTAPVQEFTLTYWNSEARDYNNYIDGDQRIFLSDMTVGINKQVPC